MGKYKIVRYHREKPPRVICEGLTLAEAQAHCQDSQTHKTDKHGGILWFDGYTTQ